MVVVVLVVVVVVVLVLVMVFSSQTIKTSESVVSTTQLEKYAQLKFDPFPQEDCSENNQTYWRNHHLDFSLDTDMI